MTTKYPCYVEFNDSGNFMRIVHKSGMIIGEFIVYEKTLAARALTAHDRLGLKDNFTRVEVPFRGEVNEISSRDLIIELRTQFNLDLELSELSELAS